LNPSIIKKERGYAVRNASFLILLILPVAVILTPAFSSASIYSWRDANGVLTYSNAPQAIPSDAQVVVRTAEAIPPVSSGIELASTAEPQMPERSPYEATEGEFIIQLARELGLGQPTDDEEAADALTNLRIAPPLGVWRFNQPMTPELTIRLRQLTVAAADRGAISITPEQALLAFDTAAALLNVDIPAVADQATIPDDPYPIADMPPLIGFYQPAPVFSPYYIWTPIAGGFWWGNTFFSGFFVLNVGLFCNHYYDHYYNYYNRYNSYDHYNRDDDPRRYRDSRARFASLDPAHISHHMKGHVENHRLRARPTPNAGRTISSPGQPRSPFSTMQSGHAGFRALRPVAAPDRVSFTRRMYSSRTPLSSPTHRSPAYRSPSYHPPSYHSLSSRSSYTVLRSRGRAAYPPASIRRAGGAGFAPARPSFRGGMATTRPAGYPLNSRRTFTGGESQRSSGGHVRAMAAFTR
jgi:Domain of unknown function (DUF4124)